MAFLGMALVASPMIVVTALSTPALASSGTISEPAANSTFTTGTTLIVKARIHRGFNDTGKVTLTMQMPGSATEYELTSHSGGATGGGDYDLQFNYDPSCPAFPGTPCQGRPAVNGTHVVRLRGTSSTVERPFVMRVPPRKPTGVNATTTSRHQITVRWDRGNEPDLAGYDLFTNGDQVVERGIAADRNEYVVNYPETGAEGDKTFYVVANRRACVGCSETLASARSDSAGARIEAPPPPSPTPDPSYSPEPSPSSYQSSDPNASPGSTSGPAPSGTPSPGATGGTSTNGSGAGSGASPGSGSSANPSASGANAQATSGSGKGGGSAAVISQRQSFARLFRDFSPKLGAPKLPPLPNFDAPEIAEDEGTYEETLDFGEQDIEELVTSAQGGGQRSVVEEFVSTAFEGRKLWSSIGWSLVLFLVAGHLRRWLNAPQRDDGLFR